MHQKSCVSEIEAGSAHLAHEAMRHLRPGIGSRKQFADTVDGMLQEGYRLVGYFDECDDEASTVAGFRTGFSLAWGRFLYIDDLVTVPARQGTGQARRVVNWLLAEARVQGCRSVHLDSGYGGRREAAHHLYLATGFNDVALHYSQSVEAAQSHAREVQNGVHNGLT